MPPTKIKANASKHKAMSYGRVKEKQKQLKEEVRQLLAQAEVSFTSSALLPSASALSRAR